MRTAKTIFVVILLMLTTILMLQNSDPVPLRFLNWESNVSQLLLVAIVLVVGFVAGFISAKLPSRRKIHEPSFPPSEF